MSRQCNTARNRRGNGKGSQDSPLSRDRNRRALLVPASTVFEFGSVCTIAAGPPKGPRAFHWAAAGRHTAAISPMHNRAVGLALDRYTNVNSTSPPERAPLSVKLLRPVRRQGVEDADRHSRVRPGADDNFELGTNAPV